MIPKIEAYTPDPTGFATGDYDRVPTRLAKYTVTHDMTAGDQFNFQTLTKVQDEKLTYRRPIRFYADDGTKLFDGLINQLEYETLGNGYKKLTGVASGWWQELKAMDMLQPSVFSNMSPNDMFEELCNIANNFGMRKQAKYTYDTDKIPYYSLFNTVYETATGIDFEFSNVYQAMQDITAYLDVAECYSPYDFGLRIEGLPTGAGESWEITENESDDDIHIIPFVLREDGNDVGTYPTFKLEAGLNVVKDYKNLCNSCIAIGDDIHTQQIRTTKILNDITLSSSDQYCDRDSQVLGDHYLAISITNPNSSMDYGWVRWTAVDGVTNPEETINVRAPGNKTLNLYTSMRACDGLPMLNAFRFSGLNGCTVCVEEITNDSSPYQTTIAGRSINELGYAPKKLANMWADDAAKANALAGKMVRLYHNPTISADVSVLSKYNSYTNVLGKPVDIHSQYTNDLRQFVVMRNSWDFQGELVTQMINGVLHQCCWDSEAAYYDVVTSGGDNVVDQFGVQVISYD